MSGQFSEDDLVQIARSVMSLLHDWEIDPRLQAALLGLPPDTKPRVLSRYRSGTPFPHDRDLLLRAKHLLSISNSLDTAFPHNPMLANFWITTENEFFGNRAPLELMLEQGIEGIERVARYLDNSFDW
jgi:hypothetical protein